MNESPVEKVYRVNKPKLLEESKKNKIGFNVWPTGRRTYRVFPEAKWSNRSGQIFPQGMKGILSKVNCLGRFRGGWPLRYFSRFIYHLPVGGNHT